MAVVLVTTPVVWSEGGKFGGLGPLGTASGSDAGAAAGAPGAATRAAFSAGAFLGAGVPFGAAGAAFGAARTFRKVILIINFY